MPDWPLSKRYEDDESEDEWTLSDFFRQHAFLERLAAKAFRKVHSFVMRHGPDISSSSEHCRYEVAGEDEEDDFHLNFDLCGTEQEDEFERNDPFICEDDTEDFETLYDEDD